MTLPKLARTKHLSRLLGPGEEIIYTAKLHPFHGFYWLLLAAGFAMLATWWTYFLVPAAVVLVVYWLPFHNTEVAVTTHRLLLRHGRFQIHSDAIDASHLDHYQLHQNIWSSVFHYGTIILNLNTFRDIRALTLKGVWDPMTFSEALTTLNPSFRSGE